MVRRLVADGVAVRAVVPAPEQGLEDFFLELTGTTRTGRRRRSGAPASPACCREAGDERHGRRRRRSGAATRRPRQHRRRHARPRLGRRCAASGSSCSSSAAATSSGAAPSSSRSSSRWPATSRASDPDSGGDGPALHRAHHGQRHVRDARRAVGAAPVPAADGGGDGRRLHDRRRGRAGHAAHRPAAPGPARLVPPRQVDHGDGLPRRRLRA